MIDSFFVYKIGPRVLKALDYICVNKARDRLYITDSQTGNVLCLTTDGKKLVYAYRNTKLKNPHGLCVDENNTVFVCGNSSQKIRSITADGKKDKTVISTMPHSPSCVAFRTTDRRILVGCSKSEDMFYYRLQ